MNLLTRALLIAALAAPRAAAVDSEASRLNDSCGAFKILPCLTTLFTDHPFHIGVTSLAPGNGFAAGPALTFAHHTKPNRVKGPDGDTITHWRLNVDGDAVVSSNLSWRAGVYLTARYTRELPTSVVQGVASSGSYDLRQKSWLFTSYVQTESLNKLTYYGIGQGSSRSNLAFYKLRETIAGGTAAIPLWNQIGLGLFGEANARIVSARSNTGEGGPSIEQAFTPAGAPGFGVQRAFAQFGEGVSLIPAPMGRFSLNYAVTMREFAAPGSSYSFERLSYDLDHEFALHKHFTPKPAPGFNGPNSCARTEANSNCPAPSMSENVEGSLGFRVLIDQSFVPSGNTVPFYFMPTLGGSDINGNSFLPSYADYRFRAPNRMLFRGTFEHSLGKLPAGFIFMADAGRVATTRGDLGFDHMAHSFATGFTVHAGGFPVLTLLFAFGGHEGTHTLAQVNGSLLGGNARPSLY